MDASHVRVVPKTYEARFFFADDARQMFGATILGNAIVTDRSDTALKAKAREMIDGDPSGDARKLANTKLVVVDLGVDKACGGLGASNPFETLILFKPADRARAAELLAATMDAVEAKTMDAVEAEATGRELDDGHPWQT